MESPEPPDEPMGSPGGASSPSKDDAPVDFDAGKRDEEKVVHVVQLPSKDVHQEVAQPENEDLFPDDMELREAEATYLRALLHARLRRAAVSYTHLTLPTKRIV